MPYAEQLHRNEWVVAPVPTFAEARSFIEQWHYARGTSNTATERHGLYHVEDNRLMGVALWMPPTRRAAESICSDWQSVLSLSRLAIHPDAPRNSASFLLGKSMKLLSPRWKMLLTYADTHQGHTGGIYLATNWTRVGYVPAGDTWVDDDGRQWGRKRGGRTLRVAEMRELGLRRVPHAPKIKFTYNRGK